MDSPLVGDVVRLLDTASVGWAGLRRWSLDRGTVSAGAGEVRQDAGTTGYRLRRVVTGSSRTPSLPAVYEAVDTTGRAWLRVDLAKAGPARTAAACLALGQEGTVGLVPAVRSVPLGVGLTVAAPDGAPLLVVPDELGLSWSALDPAGMPLARVEHIAARAGWIDRRARAVDPAATGGRNADDDPGLSGDLIVFEREARPLHRALVLGVAICRAHLRT